MSKENQDYYKVAGRSTGPAGPLKQFKGELTKSRAQLERAAKGTKKSRKKKSATERAEADLSAIDQRTKERTRAALDRLPKPPGAAGVSSSARFASGSATNTDRESPAGDGRGFSGEHGFTGNHGELGDTPPADYSLAGHGSVPYATRDAGERAADVEAQPPVVDDDIRLPGVVMRTFGPAFRFIGNFAALIDPPVRSGLHFLQRLGRSAK